MSECRIHEYDGAFRCYEHRRDWGAITDADPCLTTLQAQLTASQAECESLRAEAVVIDSIKVHNSALEGELDDYKRILISLRSRLERAEEALRSCRNDASGERPSSWFIVRIVDNYFSTKD